jgi:dihydropteroate synthase
MKKIYYANGKFINFSQFYIMGILNVTPDSFSDGGKYLTLEQQIQHYHYLLENGAQIIDIGGQSTRPYAKRISPVEEWQRISPFLEWFQNNGNQEVILSVDTFYPEIAEKALRLGANIINDVLCESLEAMVHLCKKYKAVYVLTHAQGNPSNMQENPTYQDVVEEIYQFFVNKIQKIYDLGSIDLILDPGIGFGKTVEHNYQILQHIELFKYLNLPILLGISRKSLLSKFFQEPWQNLISIQEILHAEMILKGISILRVHEPIYLKKFFKLFNLRNKL